MSNNNDDVTALRAVIAEFQQRIGALVTDYETRLAVAKVSSTQEIERLRNQITDLTEAMTELKKADDQN